MLWYLHAHCTLCGNAQGQLLFQLCKIRIKMKHFGFMFGRQSCKAKFILPFFSVPLDIHLFHDFFSSVSSDLLKRNNRSAHVECLSLSAEDKLLHSFVKTSKILLHQNLWDMQTLNCIWDGARELRYIQLRHLRPWGAIQKKL